MTDGVAERLATLQGAYDDRDRLLAEVLGVGRTDLRCLDLLVREGSHSPSELADRLHLTRGSVTTMVSRLAAKGYVAVGDTRAVGRRKLVHATQAVTERVIEAYAGHLARSSTYVNDFTHAEIDIVTRFLDATLALQQAAIDDLAAMTPAHRSRPAARPHPSRGG